MEENNAEFFVKLENPVQFRKAVLESRRDIAKTLERYESLRVLRIQKVKYISDLKNLIKDMQLMLDKLKSTFPKSKLREKMSKKASIKVLKGAAKKSSELDDLEDELRKIQSKLNIIG